MKTEKVPDGFTDIMDKKGFAHMATIGPDGAPQTSPVWYDYDGEDLLISHTKERQKFANVMRDPRVAVSILDPDNAYRFVEIRGTVEITDDPDKTLIHKLAGKYQGLDSYPYDGPDDNRVIFTLKAHRVIVHGPRS